MGQVFALNGSIEMPLVEANGVVPDVCEAGAKAELPPALPPLHPASNVMIALALNAWLTNLEVSIYGTTFYERSPERVLTQVASIFS
jgi:hypothetical protein